MNHLQGFGVFFLGGGLLAAWGGIGQLRLRRAQIRRAVAVTARIVDLVAEGGSENGDLTFHYPVVTFTIDGKTVRAKLLRGSITPSEIRLNRNLHVYCDPFDPAQVVSRLRDFSGGGAAMALGTVFVAAGAGLLWAGWSGE